MRSEGSIDVCRDVRPNYRKTCLLVIGERETYDLYCINECGVADESPPLLDKVCPNLSQARKKRRERERRNIRGCITPEADG